ncbi:mannose/fructose/sorbose PTS transporter subunit IIA [uncultured Clostridium sp.]|uniref:PTS sugar transporter subunit IIA n=1 Tax=uncultured Clostridium sp. TaxID=59620 RepID=UPI0025ECD73E|nr:mannose/fructose/sorbose PTS transporter subunit IIA [uncultured Clostridium sp.]
MIALVIGSHGMFSEELLKSSEMVFGSQSNVATVTFKLGEGIDELLEKYNNAINKLDCKDGILFMVDLFGGSPFNAASIIAVKNPDMEIVTGVNLPMLLEVFGSREFSTLEDLVSVAENSGKNSIKKLLKVSSDNSEEDEL